MKPPPRLLNELNSQNPSLAEIIHPNKATSEQQKLPFMSIDSKHKNQVKQAPKLKPTLIRAILRNFVGFLRRVRGETDL